MAKKNDEVEVIEADRAVATRQQGDVISEAIRKQVLVIGEVELRGSFEKLKLGAIVSEAVKVMKLDGAAERGPSARGGGALGWWNEVCPKNDAGETLIAYRTVMMWKQAAERMPQLLGVGEVKHDKVMKLLADDPEKAVGKDAKILKSAEKLANGMTMRQMLLWGGDEERRKAGRPHGVGETGKRVAKTADQQANEAAAFMEELCGKLTAFIFESPMIHMLTIEQLDSFASSLKTFKKKVDEIAAEK